MDKVENSLLDQILDESIVFEALVVYSSNEIKYTH
jgi:hypothetical protein